MRNTTNLTGVRNYPHDGPRQRAYTSRIDEAQASDVVDNRKGMIPMITQSHRASNYSMDEISLMPVDKVYKAMQTDAEGL